MKYKLKYRKITNKTRNEKLRGKKRDISEHIVIVRKIYVTKGYKIGKSIKNDAS